MIIGICVIPIIKLTLLMGMYYLGAALCQPIADEKNNKTIRTDGRYI